jgi:hypothetical protein
MAFNKKRGERVEGKKTSKTHQNFNDDIIGIIENLSTR